MTIRLDEISYFRQMFLSFRIRLVVHNRVHPHTHFLWSPRKYIVLSKHLSKEPKKLKPCCNSNRICGALLSLDTKKRAGLMQHCLMLLD